MSVYYAGKSFLSTAVVRWVREEGLCLDTASGGELALALRGGMPGQRIALHGNNKSEAEIARAIRNGLGRVVADSVDEIKLIERVYAELAAERVAEGGTLPARSGADSHYSGCARLDPRVDCDRA